MSAAALRRRHITAVYVAADIVLVALLVWAWSWGAREGHLRPIIYGSPGGAWDYLSAWFSNGSIWEHVRATMTVLVAGFAIGAVVGSALGLLLGASSLANDILGPFVVTFNAMPRLLFMPVLAVWLGFGMTPKVLLVVLVVVFVVTMSVATGVRDVRPDLLANWKIMGARPLDLIRHVYVPAITGWLMSSARVTVGFALQVAVLSEFFGTDQGLGFLALEGQNRFRVNQVWAAMAVMIVLAIVIDQLMGIVERRARRWEMT